jgi:lipoprotein NlpI
MEVDVNYSLDTLLKVKEILESTTELEHSFYSTKLLAEVYFLLAKEYKRRGDLENARKFAELSIKLYKKLEIKTLNDAKPILWKYLPDIMHEGVVERFISY